MVNQSPSTDPDHHLVRAIAQGDAHALHQLYGRYGPGLLNYLAGRLDDTPLAEEILQDVMLAVWHNAAGFRGESSVRTWLFSIARHRAINAHHRRPPTAAPLLDNIESDTGAWRIEQVAQRDALSDAFQKLPDDHREVLELTFYHGLSRIEAASVLDVPEGTVKSRLSRAKTTLRRILRKEGIDHA